MKLLIDHARHHALVLRAVPHNQKIILFDRTLGKIEGIIVSGFSAVRVCRGALLTYHSRARKGIYELHAVECDHVPFAWGVMIFCFCIMCLS